MAKHRKMKSPRPSGLSGYIKGKHAGPGKMFCFLVKSDACQCIEGDSEADE